MLAWVVSGAASLHLSALPPTPTLVAVILLSGVGWQQARHLARQPPRILSIPWGNAPACVDGRPVAALRVEWRGPLAWVSWQRGPGRRERLMFWPDTLPPRRRRELRLAARQRPVTQSARQWHHSVP
jgi:toxin CptA